MRVNVVCDDAVPVRVRGDALRVWQVLNNLLGNAQKFTERGHVALRMRLLPPRGGVGVREGDGDGNRGNGRAWLRFEVEDSGIGISPEQVAVLFQPFRQADASTTRRYGGSGLGLAICKHLVERMGGTIGAQGSPGAGSLFWFELPFLSMTRCPPRRPNG